MSRDTLTAAARQLRASSVMRLLLASASAALLLGAAAPAPRLIVTLQPDLAADARGRLLVFAAPGRDVAGFGPGHSVTIDAATDAFPASLATLRPGSYRVQANRTTLYASYAARFADRARLWSRRRYTTIGLGGGAITEASIEPLLVGRAGAATMIEHDVTVTPGGDEAALVLGNLRHSSLSTNGS
jgi:hypothetical protein